MKLFNAALSFLGPNVALFKIIKLINISKLLLSVKIPQTNYHHLILSRHDECKFLSSTPSKMSGINSTQSSLQALLYISYFLLTGPPTCIVES